MKKAAFPPEVSFLLMRPASRTNAPPAHFRTKSGFPGKNAVAAGQPV
ncbi:hypothetical protein BCO26_1655 [Heyndrickxia coagulans 2-6]|nr:hypothetical protein BCO26_1655 [Heyndrickxia coagulans 2-6]